MKTAALPLDEIRALGNPGTAQVLKNHGARKPVWGAKIGDRIPLIKGIKDEPDLARALFRSGVYDAMDLAGLIVNGATLGERTIREWAELDYGPGISDSTVPWVAAEHPRAVEFALDWIESPKEFVAVTGWATLSGVADEAIGTTQYIAKSLARGPTKKRKTMKC